MHPPVPAVPRVKQCGINRHGNEGAVPLCSSTFPCRMILGQALSQPRVVHIESIDLAIGSSMLQGITYKSKQDLQNQACSQM